MLHATSLKAQQCECSLHASLQVEAVKRVMSELKLTMVEMNSEEADFGGATLEGSDILFTGREFFVGISSHTNRRGAEVLADTFRVRVKRGVTFQRPERDVNVGGPAAFEASSSSETLSAVKGSRCCFALFQLWGL